MEVITVIFLFSITAANCVFILPADDETYKILLKLCNNNFAVSITKQTNVEKAAVVCVSVCVCRMLLQSISGQLLFILKEGKLKKRCIPMEYAVPIVLN